MKIPNKSFKYFSRSDEYDVRQIPEFKFSLKRGFLCFAFFVGSIEKRTVIDKTIKKANIVREQVRDVQMCLSEKAGLIDGNNTTTINLYIKEK